METKSLCQKQIESEFECLPTLDSEEVKAPARSKAGRLRAMKCKAISLPINLKVNKVHKLNSFRLSEHYHVFEKVGFGTYSEVRRAVPKDSRERVAIKIAKGTTSVKLLKNEAELLQNIESEYIPKFHRFEQDPLTNKAYLVMEFIEGKSLDVYVQENGTFSEKEANAMLIKLIKAVEALHKQGIAHRDIKPQNILITEDKNLKLIDLNISKKTKRGLSSEGSETLNKFQCIFFTQISSPMYAAPEILSLDCYTESIDIWGIGVAYAEMLFKISELYVRDEDLNKSSNISSVLETIGSNSQLSTTSLQRLKGMCAQNPEERPTIYELLSLYKE